MHMFELQLVCVIETMVYRNYPVIEQQQLSIREMSRSMPTQKTGLTVLPLTKS